MAAVDDATVTGRVQVRPAEDDEMDAAGAVVVAAYQADGLGGDRDYLQDVGNARKRAAHGTVLVALDGDEVVGSVTYARHGSPLAEVCAPGEAEFRMLGVHPDARGRGVGQALVQACIDRARADGARRLVLSTEPHSHAAHRIYRRLGFRREPALDWTPVPGVDLLVLALPLTDDAAQDGGGWS
ncbi:GNAT family N-acetyltransferase [Quadrisphaera sp. GCM10027208]|uniref:GNAT family N-acetyltransferase n=1 Tax=Quadrisphaera sp. GCM10027208 TaxID=3273423 RepID=UPI003614C1EF